MPVAKVIFSTVIVLYLYLCKTVLTFNNKILFKCHVMSLSVTTYPFPWGHGLLLLEPIPVLSQGEGRVLP